MIPRTTLSWATKWIWLVVMVTVAIMLPLPTTFARPAYSPGQDWHTSTPEEQGIDSSNLVMMLDDIQKQNHPVDALLIMRNGYVVLEAYAHPFQADQRHFLASATKSVTGALLGIAIDKGYIDGVGHKLLDFFPDRKIASVDTRKQAITLDHVLSMSSGLDWPHDGMIEKLEPVMESTYDWVQYVLDQPMAANPGSEFVYNSGGTHLLSAVIKHATGLTPLEFAHKHLFAPLGITNVTWTTDPAGLNFGASGLALTARDVARFGSLYLQHGTWDGQQVISSRWVQASTAKHIGAAELAPGYGYQWWLGDPEGAAKASGYGGQRIIVIPDLSVVVVFLCAEFPSDRQHVPEDYVASFILPAVKSMAPLPADPEQAALLDARVHTWAAPLPRPVPPLPAIAERISGKTYTLQHAVMGVDAFKFSFVGDHASVSVTLAGLSQELPIGLDGVYRLTRLSMPGAPVTIALRGSWLADDSFDLWIVQEGIPQELRLVFNGKRLEGTVTNAWAARTITGVTRE